MEILMVGMVNPEIDRHISKKWKKTKLPGKTSWKIPIWLLLFSDDHFREKSNLQHCWSIFFQEHGFSWYSDCFSQKTFLQIVQNVFLQIFSEGFLHLNYVSQWKRERLDFKQDFKFWQHASMFCFCWPWASFCRSARYSKREQTKL